jgi:hypothetical protein
VSVGQLPAKYAATVALSVSLVKHTLVVVGELVTSADGLAVGLAVGLSVGD